jgi:hypothetical protein
MVLSGSVAVLMLYFTSYYSLEFYLSEPLPITPLLLVRALRLFRWCDFVRKFHVILTDNKVFRRTKSFMVAFWKKLTREFRQTITDVIASLVGTKRTINNFLLFVIESGQFGELAIRREKYYEEKRFYTNRIAGCNRNYRDASGDPHACSW